MLKSSCSKSVPMSANQHYSIAYRKKKAIIHSMPKTTRDRNDYEISWKDKNS